VGVAGAPITVPFEAGSASLPPQALASLKVLSRQRGAGAIAVMGYGDAQGSDAATQSTALPLALARARAIAMTLMAAGVPPNAIRINAEAKGQGGVARVTD
jgi:outer membrane protein OmpA-like peptidoglycan-associated protein